MRRLLSSYPFISRKVTPELLGQIAKAGFEGVELFCSRSHFDYTSRVQIQAMAEALNTHKLTLGSLHAPNSRDLSATREGGTPLSICEVERVRRIEAMDEIKRALELAEQIPFRFLVQHLGATGESFDDRKFEAAMTSIEHLRAFAKPLGVRILLENIPNELSTPERLVEFIRAAHFDDVGVCFDFGHAHLMSDVPQAFETVRSYIHSTHVHDNAKDRDSHLWPGRGSIDWKQAMELLRSAPHTPPLLLEIEADEKVNPTEKMQEVFDRLETL